MFTVMTSAPPIGFVQPRPVSHQTTLPQHQPAKSRHSCKDIFLTNHVIGVLGRVDRRAIFASTIAWPSLATTPRNSTTIAIGHQSTTPFSMANNVRCSCIFCWLDLYGRLLLHLFFANIELAYLISRHFILLFLKALHALALIVFSSLYVVRFATRLSLSSKRCRNHLHDLSVPEQLHQCQQAATPSTCPSKHHRKFQIPLLCQDTLGMAQRSGLGGVCYGSYYLQLPAPLRAGVDQRHHTCAKYQHGRVLESIRRRKPRPLGRFLSAKVSLWRETSRMPEGLVKGRDDGRRHAIHFQKSASRKGILDGIFSISPCEECTRSRTLMGV